MREQADLFLGDHGLHDHHPVDIEWLVDVVLGIDVVPVPRLKSEHDVDGIIARDGSTIWVDWGVYMHENNFRYRYTLAHELGHWILHRELLAEAEFDTVDQWRVFLDGFSDSARGRYEHQAYCMGGLLPVQRDPLSSGVDQIVTAASAAGAELDVADEGQCRLLCRRVGRTIGLA